MIKDLKQVLTLFCLLSLYQGLRAQQLDHSWENLVLKSTDNWYATKEALAVANNVLLYQNENGGWPKNKQIHQPLSPKEIAQLKKDKTKKTGTTIDNGATFLEMTFLAKIYQQQRLPVHKDAFLNGLQYLLNAQYDNGGWPQFYPLREGYYSHITYNDDAMGNVLQLLYEIMQDKAPFSSLMLAPITRGKVALAFQKGVNCILKTQVKQKGTLTGWCAQHDVATLQPAKARAYELPSLSGKESAPIALLLMQLENPSPQVVKAIEGVVAWFRQSQLNGVEIKRIYGENGKVIEKQVLTSPNAKPLWGRFMDLEDNTPFFCDRDGIKKASLKEIGKERQNGYRWYTDQPQAVLDLYPKWREKLLDKRQDPTADLYNMVVAQDGTGHFSSIQEAVNSAKAFPYQRVFIHIKKGIYPEKVTVNEWNPKISFLGDGVDQTIISYDDHFSKVNTGRNSTFKTPSLLIAGDGFIAKNLTVENTAGPVGQAIALSVNADQVVLHNCNFKGNQDTVYTTVTNHKVYFNNCYIEGTTDFIFGSATVWFQECTLHSKSDSYITAASTQEGIPFGFVFKSCKLTAAEGVQNVFLGRPWRSHAKTVFIDCNMEGHISPLGWDNWSNKAAEKTTFYGEYNSSGAGAHLTNRVAWSHQLSAKEALDYTKEGVLGGTETNAKNKWYELD